MCLHPVGSYQNMLRWPSMPFYVDAGAAAASASGGQLAAAASQSAFSRKGSAASLSDSGKKIDIHPMPEAPTQILHKLTEHIKVGLLRVLLHDVKVWCHACSHPHLATSEVSLYTTAMQPFQALKLTLRARKPTAPLVARLLVCHLQSQAAGAPWPGRYHTLHKQQAPVALRSCSCRPALTLPQALSGSTSSHPAQVHTSTRDPGWGTSAGGGGAAAAAVPGGG